MREPDELRTLLLKQRGVEGAAAENFFASKYERDIHDPNSLYGMALAVERVKRAIKKSERIVVYGDYDVDGVSSLAIMVHTLRSLGAHVCPYVPDRNSDGYGLNPRVLQGLKGEMDLLITVDCGISNAAEVAQLKKDGIDVIVTDHHEVPAVIPEAFAVIHPRHPAGKYAWGYLAGAGVAWKFAQALLREMRPGTEDEKWLLDLAVLGTLADVVPLLGENRAIVRFGLEVLRRTRRPGLRALIDDTAGDRFSLTEEEVTFRIIPRLNAAGRMDHAQPALDLLLATEENKAAALVQQVNQYNQRRQTETKRIIREAEAQVDGGGIVFASSEGWSPGVVGLAAGRLAEKYQVPAVIVGSNGREMVGSARSPKAINILEVLSAGAEHLLKMGGHACAAGFTVAEGKLELLKETLKKAQLNKPAGPGAVSGTADAVVGEELLTRRAWRMLSDFAPFGEGNKRPRLLAKSLRIMDMRTVGKSGDHVKFTFFADNEPLGGIGFGLAEEAKDLKRGMAVDVLGELSENEFRGRSELQIEVKDVAEEGRVKIIE